MDGHNRLRAGGKQWVVRTSESSIITQNTSSLPALPGHQGQPLPPHPEQQDEKANLNGHRCRQ